MIPRLILAGLLGAALLCAQGKKGGGNNNLGEMPMPRTENRMDQMDGILKLNKDQRKQVKSIMDDGQKEAAPLRDQIAKTELDLGEAVAAGKSQDEIDKAANACGTLQAQMTGVEMKAFAKIYQTLDKDQQQNAGRVFFMMQGIFKGKNWIDVKP
jgi:Spy/CpxP family protein refolding chaperone